MNRYIVKFNSGVFAVIAILLVGGYSAFVFAAAPSGGYTPGQTLDPNCAPGDTDCVVALPSGGSGWGLSGNAVSSGNFIGTTNNQPFVIKTNNAERMRILANGNVGIGTTTPANAFDVVGGFSLTNGNFLLASTPTLFGGSPGLLMVNTSGSLTNGFVLSNTFSALSYNDTGTNHANSISVESSQVAMTSNYDNSNPAAPSATVMANAQYGSQVVIIPDNSQPSKVYGLFVRMPGNSDTVQIFGDGNTSRNLLRVHTYFGISPGTDVFTIRGDGNIVAAGTFAQGGATSCSVSADSSGTLICTPSDRNLKQNIQDSAYGLDAVMKLRPVTYQFRDPKFGAGNQIGFIAQELEQVVPEVVTHGPNYLSVNYGLLTSVNTKAIQELNLKLRDIQNVASATDQTFLSNLKSWLANATNGIATIIADTVQARNRICVDDVCMTKDQLRAMLAAQGIQNAPVVPPVSNPAPAPNQDQAPVDNSQGSAPGSNPASDSAVQAPDVNPSAPAPDSSQSAQ